MFALPVCRLYVVSVLLLPFLLFGYSTAHRPVFVQLQFRTHEEAWRMYELLRHTSNALGETRRRRDADVDEDSLLQVHEIISMHEFIIFVFTSCCFLL